MELQPLQQLRELSLQGNQAITDAGLVGLARLQSLEALDLQLCWQVRRVAPTLEACCIAWDPGSPLPTVIHSLAGRRCYCAVRLNRHQFDGVRGLLRLPLIMSASSGLRSLQEQRTASHSTMTQA